MTSAHWFATERPNSPGHSLSAHQIPKVPNLHKENEDTTLNSATTMPSRSSRLEFWPNKLVQLLARSTSTAARYIKV